MLSSPELWPRVHNRRIHHWLLFILAAVIVQVRCSRAAETKEPQVRHGVTKPVSFLNTSPGVAYVGSRVCAGCHPGIYESYIHTAMGRSIFLPDNAGQLEKVPIPFQLYDKRSHHFFRAFRDHGGLFMTDKETDDNGKEIFSDTKQVSFILGSGSNGFAFIVRRGNYLFQSPLTYYVKSHLWGLSPGYEKIDLAFTRPIRAECIVCHSGRPQPVPGRNGLYRN